MTDEMRTHDTIRLERTFDHPVGRVFRAYADVEERTRWSAPSEDEFVSFQTDDFRVGGIDQFTCGQREGGATFAGTTRYESVAADQHIVFTERLTGADDALLAMSLVTWRFDGDDERCRLTIIDKVTSFAVDGPITGSRQGYKAMLDQLHRQLETVPDPRPDDLEVSP